MGCTDVSEDGISLMKKVVFIEKRTFYQETMKKLNMGWSSPMLHSQKVLKYFPAFFVS